MGFVMLAEDRRIVSAGRRGTDGVTESQFKDIVAHSAKEAALVVAAARAPMDADVHRFIGEFRSFEVGHNEKHARIEKFLSEWDPETQKQIKEIHNHTRVVCNIVKALVKVVAVGLPILLGGRAMGWW